MENISHSGMILVALVLAVALLGAPGAAAGGTAPALSASDGPVGVDIGPDDDDDDEPHSPCRPHCRLLEL